MFGQAPKLPVDFLLAGVEEPVGGQVSDWVREHGDTLRVTYRRVRARLDRAAGLRKMRHDQERSEVRLQEGQEVYVRDLGIRGRHKIQNHWSSLRYRVVRAPRGDGGVYTIAQIGDPSRTKQVHRSYLKPASNVVCPDPVADPGLGPFEDEDELFVPGETAGEGEVIVIEVVSPVPSVVEVGQLPEEEPVIEESRESRVEVPVLRGDPLVQPREDGRRKTTRATAGRHANPYRLPRAVIQVQSVQGSQESGNLPGPPSQNQGPPFRPWL